MNLTTRMRSAVVVLTLLATPLAVGSKCIFIASSGDDDDNHGDENDDDHGDHDDGDHDNGDNGDHDDGDGTCGAEALIAGRRVSEGEIRTANGGAVWTDVQLD